MTYIIQNRCSCSYYDDKWYGEGAIRTILLILRGDIYFIYLTKG